MCLDTNTELTHNKVASHCPDTRARIPCDTIEAGVSRTHSLARSTGATFWRSNCETSNDYKPARNRRVSRAGDTHLPRCLTLRSVGSPREPSVWTCPAID